MAKAAKQSEALTVDEDRDPDMVVPVGLRPPRPTPGIRQLARASLADALTVITNLMRDKDAPAATRLAAANSLLDRAVGKGEEVSTIRSRPKASAVLSSQELEYLSWLYCDGGSYQHEARDFLVEEQTDDRVVLRCKCGGAYIEVIDGYVTSHGGIRKRPGEGDDGETATVAK